MHTNIRIRNITYPFVYQILVIRLLRTSSIEEKIFFIKYTEIQNYYCLISNPMFNILLNVLLIY